MHFQVWQFVVTAILQLHRKEVIMDSCGLLLTLGNKSVFQHWIRLLYTALLFPHYNVLLMVAWLALWE